MDPYHPNTRAWQRATTTRRLVLVYTLVTVITIEQVGRATPPPPRTYAETFVPRVLHVWGPEVDGRCVHRTWVRETGWATRVMVPHGCPADEAELLTSDAAIRWTGDALWFEQHGAFVRLPPPAGAHGPLLVGFLPEATETLVIASTGSKNWALPISSISGSGPNTSPNLWTETQFAWRPDEATWASRRLDAALQDTLRRKAGPMHHANGAWTFDALTVRGLPAGEWFACYPSPTPPRVEGGHPPPRQPPNRALIAAYPASGSFAVGCAGEPRCVARAPLFVVAQDGEALPVNGPEGAITASQMEDVIAVLDHRGLWIVDAKTADASFVEGVTSTYWSHFDRRAGPRPSDQGRAR